MKMLLPRSKLMWPLLGVLLLSSIAVHGDPDEDASMIARAAFSYPVFPGLDPDPSIYADTEPIDVFAIQAIISINDISPGTSEFTATTRVSYFWTTDACNQTKSHQFACDTNLSDGAGARFMNTVTAKGLPTRLLSIENQDVYSTVFEEEGRSDLVLDLQQLETRATYIQSFDMRYYPWEIHGLEIPLQSLYSSDLVRLTRFPNNLEAQLAPSVPNGWEFLGTKCDINFGGDDTRIEDEDGGGGLKFYSYNCVVVVARRNPGWWVTSFLLFAALMMMAFAGSVGITSHMVAEARDDRDSARRALYDGTRLVGTYTIGLLLTYVFQVQISPYGQSVEYWPSVPTSTMIYVLGLVGIIVQSFGGLIGSVLFTKPLLAEGFIGGLFGPYDLEKIPLEGNAGEDRAPLLLKRFDPNEEASEASEIEPLAEKGKTFDSDAQATADVPKEGEPLTDGAKEDEKQAEEAPKEEEMSISKTRKNNQKTYHVLSLEEAVLINNYVRQLFLLKVSLLLIVTICATVMLSVARSNFGKLKDEVLEILEDSS